jgi:glycosyltransferase domain-containing protein
MNDLTIVIPTHNRHKYLKRVLAYYEDYNVDIVVVDSSKEHFTGDIKSIGVKYHHLPEIDYEEKLHYVLKNIKTKYTTLCADDDFIVKSAINKCVNFLDSNSDYGSVQGNHIYYNMHKNSMIFAPFHFEAYGLDIDEDNFYERLEKLSLPVKLFINYALHRTSILQQIFEFLTNSNIKEVIFAEFILQLMPVISAKHKVLPIFYIAREWNVSSGGYKLKGLESILIEDGGEDKFNSYKMTFSNHVSKFYNRDLKEVKSFFDNFFDFYLKSNFSLAEQNLSAEQNIHKTDNITSINYNSNLVGFPSNSDDKESMSDLKDIEKILIKYKHIYDKPKDIDNIVGLIDKDFYIYGAGLSSMIVYDLIKRYTNYNLLAYIDDFKSGVIDGVKIKQLSDIKKSSLIMVSPNRYCSSILQILKDESFSSTIFVDQTYFGC